jgi:DNA-binding NarL/FixJ family response regulator
VTTLRAGQRCHARAAATAARAEFSGAAAPARVGVADEPLGRSGASGVGRSLTSTETRVAALVATGRRNRANCHRTVVTVSTIEAHLTRVYREPGATVPTSPAT